MTAIERHRLVDDVMREWPATIRVFLDFRMRCIGCPIGVFHTVEDACREHDVDIELFLRTLRATAAAEALSGPAGPGFPQENAIAKDFGARSDPG